MVENSVATEEINDTVAHEVDEGIESSSHSEKHSNGSIVSSVQNIYVLHSEEDSEKLVQNESICRTYLLHGVCSDFTDCPRHHLRYENSSAIQIRNLFQSLRPEEESNKHPSELDATQADIDTAADKRLKRDYKKFYNNIIVKFRSAGPIIMFKCCRNHDPSLNGNVYVRYVNHEFATRALNMFNGFSFNGRELEVELCPIINWKTSLCSHYEKDQMCPEKESCGLLHTFSNPRDEYPAHTISYPHMAHPADRISYPQTYKRILKCKRRSKGFGMPKELTAQPKYSKSELDSSLKSHDAEKRSVTTMSTDNEMFELKMNDPQYCRIYLKSGACAAGKGCFRLHPLRTDSPTIMIPNFFQHPHLKGAENGRNVLRCPLKESELQVAYKNFYESVIDKFRTAGKVVMFKTMRNAEPHLAGNVYVQYENHASAVAAMEQFNESKYAINGGFRRAELSSVVNWLIATCVTFLKQKMCWRDNCGFLHPFDNPNNEYIGRVALNQENQKLTAQLELINDGQQHGKLSGKLTGFGRNVFAPDEETRSSSSRLNRSGMRGIKSMR